MQLDVEDNRKRNGKPVVSAYSPDDAIESLKVLPQPIQATTKTYIVTSRPHHDQAETMHNMVETFEYDGEPHFLHTIVHTESPYRAYRALSISFSIS